MSLCWTAGNFETYVFSSWRKSLLRKLNERRQHEHDPFEAIVSHCSRLFETLECQPCNSKHASPGGALSSTSSLASNLPQSHAATTFLCDRCPSLEKKLFSAQEELTSLHRKKDELSTKLLTLNEQVQSSERERNVLQAEIDQLKRKLTASESTVKQMQRNLQEQKDQTQLLLDEYETCQTAFNALNERFVALDKEHAELVNRWMQAKAKDAERLNQENERAQKVREQQQQAQLQQAVAAMPEPSDIGSPTESAVTGDISGGYVLARLPTKVRYQLVDAHDGEVNALFWMPGDGGRLGSNEVLVTAGGDRKVKMWALTSSAPQCLQTLTGSNAAITSIDVRDEYLLASSSDFASRLWTAHDGKLRRTLTGHSSKVSAVRFLGPPSRAVSGSYDRTLKVWDTNKCACTRTLFAGSSCNDLVAREGQDSEVISAHFDKRIRFWDLRSGKLPNEILLPGRVTGLALGPADHQLLSCDRDDQLRLLDLRMNQVVRSFSAPGFKVGCDWTRVAFAPDGEYVAAGSADGQLFVWNTLSGRLERSLKDAHTSNVNACAWNAQGCQFASVDKSRHLVIWSP
jgi:autophagy-related protein 16